MPEPEKSIPSGLGKADRTQVGDDTQAKREASALANDTLDEESKKNDHARKESLRDHAVRGAKIVFWLFISLSIAATLSLAVHLLMPSEWHWLNAEQQDKVKTILFSGALATVITNYSKRYF